MIDINKIIKEYRVAAELHASSLDKNGDFKTSNEQAEKLKKIYEILQNNPEIQLEVLGLLIKDKNPNTRGWAAAHCLGLKILEKEAVSVLDKLSKSKDIGIISFNAEMTLKVWRKQGYLKF